MGLTWPGWFDGVNVASSRDHINLGNVFRKNGATRKALSAYKKAYSMNPKDPEGWFLAGTVHLNLGRPDQALDHLTKAAEQCPQGVDIILNLANAHFMKGEVEKAESYYKSLIELNRKINLFHKRTSVAKAHIGLRRLYHGQGQAAEAERQMEYAWQLSDQVAAEYSVINGLALKRSSEAFERLASEELWNWYPRANLGIAYLKMGRFEEAVVELERAASMRGALPGVSFHLGLALIKAGRIEEGKKVLERLSSRLPENSLRRRVQGLLNSI
jgi:tetratricopeptide (TPR) repeat protein